MLENPVPPPTPTSGKKPRRAKGDKDEIVQKVLEIIQLFGTKMSLRQIYYQLVSKQIIQNRQNEYKMLSDLLVKARKNGVLDYDDLEDRTRKFETFHSQKFDEIDDDVDSMINYINNGTYRVPLSLYQPIIHIIAVEKQALESFFRTEVPRDSNVILIINRGYNSLTQIHELAQKCLEFKKIDAIHCSYFGDHDPTGFDIERNFNAQLEEQGVHLESYTRIGITKEQINQFGLPEDPAKSTDARTRTWNRGGCVELDALPPDVLRQLIRDRIAAFWDIEIAQETQRLNVVLNRRFHNKLEKRLLQQFGGSP